MRLVVTEGYSIAIDDTIVEGFAYLTLLCHSCSTKNPRTKMGVVAGNIAPKVSLTVWQFIGGQAVLRHPYAPTEGCRLL